MHHFIRKSISILAIVLMLFSLLPVWIPATAAQAADDPVVNLQLLETTDLHANIMDYDYYSDTSTKNFGLARTAQLINKHRNEAKNTILVDNGDTIQGSPLGEYIHKNPNEFPDGLPIYKTLNLLHYDAGTVGNHEFNYGLDFLNKSLDAANFPIVNANVLKPDGSYYFKPYEIVPKEVTDENGKKHTIKIGYTGFTPPQIMTWDKANLEGKVVAKDIVASAQKVIPEMKKEGAELIIVLAHSGIVPQEQEANAENAVYDLALKVPGIDAIVSGHQHGVFPGPNYTGNKIDTAKGTINGVPVVMAKSWGSHLGVIDLKLKQTDGDWKVIDSQSTAEPITSVTEPDPQITEAIKPAHEKTLSYVRNPVGQTEAPINSFFALVRDDPSIQIVTDAQKWYAQKAMADTKYKDLPILSAGAPFKAGGRQGVDYYTNIAKGDLAIKNVGDLYLYDNTLYVLKLTGAEIKDWLEMSAGQFNQIDPKKTNEQQLINTDFPTYNYDVIDGVTYQIDVTQPAKYKSNGEINDANASRIKNLRFNGKAIDPNQEFLVASNNYRASGGGNFPHIDSNKVVLASTVENRQALIDYITEKKTINPSADGNWSFAPVNGSNVRVAFDSSPSARDFAGDQITYVGASSEGFAKYTMNLPEDHSWDLTILHTNDTHSHLDNIARRATEVKKERQSATNSILVDAGDMLSGDLYYTKWDGLDWKGSAELKFMNLIGYDAMTLGNHEFDDGPSNLANFVKEADFPIVSSNIDFSKEPALSPLLQNHTTFTAGETKKPGIYPYVILNISGEKVGVFGLTTEDTGEASSPGDNIIFKNAAESAKDTVKAITDNEKVNKIVALSHLGYARDPSLAKEVEGIDVIVGGHSHTELDKPDIIKNDATPTVIVQANEWNKFLGRLDVAFDDKGVVLPDETSGKLIPIDESVPEDPDIKDILDNQYKSKIDVIKKQVVGKSSVYLDGERDHVRTKETNLGNLIADGMLDKARSTAKGRDTAIAIQNGGGIRGPINEGDITLGDVRTVLPFGNTLYLVDITGEQLVQALENGVKGIDEVAGPFPQVAGMKYTFTRNKPAGERILHVEIKNADGTFSPVDPKKTYKLVTNNFVGKGGDGYDVLKSGKNAIDLGIADYQVFTDYLDKHNGSVSPAVEGRITEVFEPTISNDGKISFDDSFLSYVGQTNDVIINLPGTENWDMIELQFSKEQIKALKARPSFTIKNGKIGLTIPTSNLSEAAATVKITKTEAVKDALTDVYDFSIVQEGKAVHTFKDKVTLMFTLGTDADDPSVYYVDRANSKLTEIDSDYQNDTVYGYVDHFSEYTVLEKAAAKDTQNQPDDTDSQNQDNDNPSGQDSSDNNQNNNQPQQNNDQQNNSQKDNSHSVQNGQDLPKTGDTNMSGQIVAGLLLIAAAIVVYVLYRRKSHFRHSDN